LLPGSAVPHANSESSPLDSEAVSRPARNSPHPFEFTVNLASGGGRNVEDWKFTEKDPSEALARLHFFSIKKKHASGEVEARITVKEFATAKTSDMKFFAVADIELNQKTMKFQPCGWAETLMGALTECLRNLRKFEYESHDLPTASSADGAQL
jgi:hypothetical protein